MIKAEGSAEQTPEEVGSVLMPLVDVVFMLVVFLLLTANVAPYAMEVQTPTSDHAVTQTEMELIILQTPDEEGDWRINERRLHEADARDELARLLALDPEQTLVILADANASAQTLIDAMDMARSVGAASVDIAVEPNPL